MPAFNCLISVSFVCLRSDGVVGPAASTEGVDNGQLRELYVSLLDKYRTHENAKADYKGSQMVLIITETASA